MTAVTLSRDQLHHSTSGQFMLHNIIIHEHPGFSEKTVTNIRSEKTLFELDALVIIRVP